MRAIWGVYSPTFTSDVIFESPDYTQSVGGTEEDYFPQLFTPFSSLRPVTTPVKNFSVPLDVKEIMFLLLGLCSPHHI